MTGDICITFQAVMRGDGDGDGDGGQAVAGPARYTAPTVPSSGDHV